MQTWSKTDEGRDTPDAEERQVDRIMQLLEERWAARASTPIKGAQQEATQSEPKQKRTGETMEQTEPIQEEYRNKGEGMSKGMGKVPGNGRTADEQRPIGKKRAQDDGTRRATYEYQKTREQQIPAGGYITPDIYINQEGNQEDNRATDSEKKETPPARPE